MHNSNLPIFELIEFKKINSIDGILNAGISTLCMCVFMCESLYMSIFQKTHFVTDGFLLDILYLCN